MATLLIIHTASTVFMTGVIWYVQLVHYPSFDRIVRSEYPAFQAFHERRTGWIVVPAMTTELVSGLTLFFVTDFNGLQPWLWVNTGLLLFLWTATFFVQVPLHRKLHDGFDGVTHGRLVNTNWLRTVAWSARSVILLFVLLNRPG